MPVWFSLTHGPQVNYRLSARGVPGGGGAATGGIRLQTKPWLFSLLTCKLCWRVAVFGVAKVLIDSLQGHKLFWNSSSLLAKLAGESFATVNKNFYRVGQG